MSHPEGFRRTPDIMVYYANHLYSSLGLPCWYEFLKDGIANLYHFKPYIHYSLHPPFSFACSIWKWGRGYYPTLSHYIPSQSHFNPVGFHSKIPLKPPFQKDSSPLEPLFSRLLGKILFAHEYPTMNIPWYPHSTFIPYISHTSLFPFPCADFRFFPKMGVPLNHAFQIMIWCDEITMI